MRNIVFIAILLNMIGFSFQQKELDTVEFNSIKVISPKSQSYSPGSAEDLQTAFGKATIEKTEDEVLGGYAYIHKYDGLEAYFNEKSLESFSVNKRGFQVMLEGKVYNVGDRIEKLNKDFPVSFKNREQRTPEIGMIHLGITNQKVLADAYVVISYDRDQIITEIWVGNDNS